MIPINCRSKFNVPEFSSKSAFSSGIWKIFKSEFKEIKKFEKN